MWYSNTQNNFSARAAIFSLHTLASPSGRNVNYDEKELTGKKINCSFYLYRFRKHVSYGFPITNFCNPGVHYKTPCIFSLSKFAASKKWHGFGSDKRAGQNPLLFSTKNTPSTTHTRIICDCVKWWTCLLAKRYRFSRNWIDDKESVRVRLTYRFEYTYVYIYIVHEKICSIILVALIAHHTPGVRSCSDN